MAKNIKNTAASVHQRLLNKAKDTTRPFNELLQHFAIERFIYRLSKNPHADRFLLKGALMFLAWTGLDWSHAPPWTLIFWEKSTTASK